MSRLEREVNVVAMNMLPGLLLSCLLLGTAGPARANEEQQRLRERADLLQGRVEVLKEEQDLLLFRKELSVSDSKYLLLDLGAGAGEIRFRSRILKTFSFPRMRRAEAIRRLRGPLVLTEKRTDRKKNIIALVFGRDLVLELRQGTRRSSGKTGAVTIALSRRDLSSLLFALDKGSLAYFVR